MKKAGYAKEQTAIVGDRLYTDIACGVNADISTVFVLSREGTMEDIDKYGIQPEITFDNIKELYYAIK